MPEDNRFGSPIKAITLIESILKIRTILRDTSLLQEEREPLIDQLSFLLKEGSIELRKPTNPVLSTEEEKKYFREPLASYFHELAREMHTFSLSYIDDLPPKKSRKKSRKKQILRENEILNGIDKESAIWFRLLSKDSFKQFKRMQYLDQLVITDEEEDNERKERCEIYLFLPYLISRYISLRLELINTSEGWKKELLNQKLLKKEEQVEYYDRFKFILDKIITISLTLNNKALTEEERTRNIQEREKLRTQYKIENVKLIKNGIRMEEDFDDFTPKKDKLNEMIDQYIKHLIGK